MARDEAGAAIPTNLRLVALIEEAAGIGAPATPTELNARLGLPKPTAHRLCDTLVAAGFLARDLDGRRLTPGPRLRRLAAGVMSSLDVATARRAVLAGLAREIGETCNIAIPDGDAMLYLDRVETEWPLRIQLPAGTRVPLYCTAAGKMYLATLTRPQRERCLAHADLAPHGPNTLTATALLERELTRTRKRGYAVDDEEFIAGMVALAVPVCEPQGRIVATLSFHAPTQRMTLTDAAAALPRLVAAAEELALLIAPPDR